MRALRGWIRLRRVANRRAAVVAMGLLAFVALLLSQNLQSPPHSVRAASTPTPSADAQNPDARCAACHAAIYASYEKTAMARGSGPAFNGFLSGGFTDSSSGVKYQVFQRDGAMWMSYSRGAATPQGALSGEHRLEYFVGSGHRGRTFLYQQQGLWFELPINYYTRRDVWDMAPNYSGRATMPAPLPVDTNCLHCHSTGVERSDGLARNSFAGRPFAQGGIGCSACHGDPTEHLATKGSAPMVNPAKLTPDRRDSACIQCHLEGDAVVYKPGRSLAQFTPGDRLSDIARYFVRASQAAGGARGTSQYEALLQSACKRASGDKLTCTTCHDPHSSPAPADRVAFYRAKCLACHTDPKLAATHHPEQPSCASCHMPSRDTTDISHEQVTDHNIQRVPGPQQRATSHKQGEELVPVGGGEVTDRDLGLAYAQMAQRGDVASGRKAFALLSKAEQAGEHDEQLSLNLGFLQQVSGHAAEASEEYQQVLKTNPHEPAALSNLAVLEAAQGHAKEAMTLLGNLVSADPSQTGAGMNLILLQCGTRQPEAAQKTGRQLAVLNPDSEALRTFLRDGCPATRRIP